MCNRLCKIISYIPPPPHVNKNVNVKTCRIAVGGNLVCQREWGTGVRVGEIFRVWEGGENRGEWGDIWYVRGPGRTGVRGKVFGVSEGVVKRGEGVGDIWSWGGRGDREGRILAGRAAWFLLTNKIITGHVKEIEMGGEWIISRR